MTDFIVDSIFYFLIITIGSPSVGPAAISSISNEVAALLTGLLGNFLHFIVNFSVPSGSSDDENLRRIPRNQSIPMPSKINFIALVACIVIIIIAVLLAAVIGIRVPVFARK